MAQLIETITGINKHSAARLCFLSEELKDFLRPLSPSTLFLALAYFFILDIHLQRPYQPLRLLPLCCPRLYI